jgi:hypothetical protein
MAFINHQFFDLLDYYFTMVNIQSKILIVYFSMLLLPVTVTCKT